MKTPEEILNKNLSQRSDSFDQFYRFDVLESMKEYAEQFKTKICPCQQQEAELKEIKRINKAS